MALDSSSVGSRTSLRTSASQTANVSSR
jgi:hypothetical protein